MTEPTYPCPKCGQFFALSQLNHHYPTCQGKPVQQQQQVPQFPQQQYTPPPQQLYIPPPKPEHKHRWSENNTYKVCIDYLYNPTEECREIKVKLRGSWQIFIRYGLKLFFIQLVIAFAVVLAISSYVGIRR